MKPIIEIYRIDASSSDGVFGVLQVQKKFRFACLEPYHRDNEKSISCIPAGMYKVKKVNSPTYGTTYEICDIHGRSHVLFHSGNYDHNSKGCVLVGTGFGLWSGNEVITDSRAAFSKFLQIMGPYDEAELVIRECY